MSPVDFAFSILASWLANRLEPENKPSIDITPEQPEPDSVKPEKREKLFRVYDVYTELEDILSLLETPVAHLLVETSPSSFYNLASLVLESQVTGEWYVFCRGRMAFQGTGGGLQQSERAITIFKNSGIPIATWSITANEINDLDNGYVLWHKIKKNLIPLQSAVVDSDKWSWIQEKAEEMINGK